MKQFVGSGSELISKILSEPRTNLGILFLSESEAEDFCVKALVDFAEGIVQQFFAHKQERKITELAYLENLKAEFHKSLSAIPELSPDFVANAVVAFQNFIEERNQA